MSRKGVKRTQWTREQKCQAAIQYAIEGSLTKIERDQGIPKATTWSWKENDPLWVEIVTQLQTEKGDEHRAQYVQLVDKAQAKALELIPTMTDAKAAMLMSCMGTDKIRLHDGLATSITGKAVTSEDLLNKFAAIAREYNRKVVSEQ